LFVGQKRVFLDVGGVRDKFRKMEEKEAIEREDDVYDKDYAPKKYTKDAAGYGTPKPGTLSEARAASAGRL
jgi:hypothetical protein